MKEIQTHDLYEASFYLLNGVELLNVEGVYLNSKVKCRMTFSGENLADLQVSYFDGEASANLFDFRRTYFQLCALVKQETSKFKREQNDAKQQALKSEENYE